MRQDRRTFLKTTALAGVAAAGVPFTSTAPLAQKAAVGSQTMARGFVFATLRRQNGYGLGVRTDRGVLDVVAAEQDLKEGAPTSITDVFDGKAWTTGPPLPTARDHLAGVSDGRYAYALGGRELSSDKNVNAVERFDPATGNWAAITPMPTPRSATTTWYVRSATQTRTRHRVLRPPNTRLRAPEAAASGAAR